MVDVTEENLHRFKFSDVVMPLVGNKTRFCKNEELNKIIFDIMKEDNISIELFGLIAKIDSAIVHGSYRKIVAFADDV